MPRVTRAALRSVEQQDGSDIAATVPLPATPLKDRVPLGETTGNQGVHIDAANTSEEQAAPAKKRIGKGKKGNAAKKANKKTEEKVEEICAGVLEDGSQSIQSTAADEASQELLKDGSQEPTGITQILDDKDRPHTPPSAAANAASRQLTPKPTTPYKDSEMPKPSDATTSEGNDEKEDSFVAKIELRTPLKMTNNERVGTPPKEGSDKDDSFLEQIKARTPGKRVSRIEDSVEAIDALEEEIEKVGGLIPAGANGPSSHDKPKKQAKPQSTAIDSKSSRRLKTVKSDAHQKAVEARRSSTYIRPPESKPSSMASVNRVTLSKGAATYDGCQPTGLTVNTGPAASHAVPKKRISSVHKAPFQPIKSTKPPTRPNFELPGEAVARKLKEQREGRSKHEEDEAAKPRVFKARPVRQSHAPAVKLTATTKARLSMAKGEHLGNSKLAARPTPMATVSPNKRLSTLSVPKRSTPPIARRSTAPFASGAARLTRGPSLSASTTIRAPSALGANRPPPTAEESALQKMKGKEVFGRTRAEIAEREKAKKEKEDAARKARAQAAERGRLASRAWAEKQKAKKLEAGKENAEGA